MLRDSTIPTDDTSVGRGIGTVEDERAVVRESVHAKHAVRAADADLERAARIQIDRAVRALGQRTGHRHEAAIHRERAGAVVDADFEVTSIGPRAARYCHGAGAAVITDNALPAVGDSAAADVERAGAADAVADGEIVVRGPRAARYRDRADAEEVVADNARPVGDDATGHVQRAGLARYLPDN